MAPQRMGAETKGRTTVMLAGICNGWANRGLYELFERVALIGLMFVISLITVFAFCVTITQLFADARFLAIFMDKVALRDTFGSF
jgi:hypothetical protein